jgi:hypothetical protein
MRHAPLPSQTARLQQAPEDFVNQADNLGLFKEASRGLGKRRAAPVTLKKAA